MGIVLIGVGKEFGIKVKTLYCHPMWIFLILSKFKFLCSKNLKKDISYYELDTPYLNTI